MPSGGRIGNAYGEALLEARARNFALREAQAAALTRAFQEAASRLAVVLGTDTNPVTRERALALQRQFQVLTVGLEVLTRNAVAGGRAVTIQQTTELHRQVNRALVTKELGAAQAQRILSGRFDQAALAAAQALASRKYGAANYATLIRRNMADAGPDLDRLLTAGVARGVSAQDLARDVGALIQGRDPDLAKYALLRGDVTGVRTLAYDARRIAVTEINNALREANTQALVASPIVLAATWTLSGRHDGLPSSPDECDDLANANRDGLGQGVYRVDDWPLAPHPFCGCSQGGPIIYRPPSEWGQGTGSTTPTPQAPQDATPPVQVPVATPPAPGTYVRSDPRTYTQDTRTAAGLTPADMPFRMLDPRQPGMEYVRAFFDPLDAREYFKNRLHAEAIFEIAPSNPLAKKWGNSFANPADALKQANLMASEWESMRRRYPDMPQSPYGTFYVTDSNRGLSSVGLGRREGRSMVTSAWQQPQLDRAAYWERTNGRRWGASPRAPGAAQTPEYSARLTFRHELGHGLSSRRVVDEWNKMVKDLAGRGILKPDKPPRKGYPPGASVTDGQVLKWRREWFKREVSEYSAVNGSGDPHWEEIAEVFAMVTDPEYVRGMLPAAMEEFVEKLMLNRTWNTEA